MRNFLACLSGAQVGWINEIKKCQKISWGGGGGFDGDDDFGGSAPLPIPHHISVFVLGPPATELTLTISSVSSPLSLIHLQVCADRPAWQIFCADISFDWSIYDENPASIGYGMVDCSEVFTIPA